MRENYKNVRFSYLRILCLLDATYIWDLILELNIILHDHSVNLSFLNQ